MWGQWQPCPNSLRLIIPTYWRKYSQQRYLIMHDGSLAAKESLSNIWRKLVTLQVEDNYSGHARGETLFLTLVKHGPDLIGAA